MAGLFEPKEAVLPKGRRKAHDLSVAKTKPMGKIDVGWTRDGFETASGVHGPSLNGGSSPVKGSG